MQDRNLQTQFSNRLKGIIYYNRIFFYLFTKYTSNKIKFWLDNSKVNAYVTIELDGRIDEEFLWLGFICKKTYSWPIEFQASQPLGSTTLVRLTL